MDTDYWLRQTPKHPLFPDLIWSRPENKVHAGKLLILGGNAHSFADVGESYNESLKAGIGSVRVMLPVALKKTLQKVFAAGEYLPSTPSGSLSRQSLGEVLEGSDWADACLLAGDFGHNSETAVLLEQFVIKNKGLMALTQDSLDYFYKSPGLILDRQHTLLSARFDQLQKIATASKFTQAFTSSIDLLRFVELLHDFTTLHKAALVTFHLDNIFVAYQGKVSTTKPEVVGQDKPVATAAHATVWWLQNPTKTFEAISSALVAAYS